ncbi:XRE family transcriptional regulator [Parablautia intestinalis]|jgi:transcriptional regulator with XRE-family HTH domain|uniref:XRE family transcriptional regulator n=2 Tax=Parablautia intestinalis TaxID=2320100 RepID=A0A3A9AEP0_9FIRM|nr:XRE family transcriptional regulator [Parablautia intestinalis]
MEVKMSYKDIGFRIRSLREANCYTRDALAEKVDISAKFLYEIEVGKKGFTVEILYKISRALNVSSDYILTGNESNKIPEKMVDVLECFSPNQMGRVQDILKVVHELCVGDV